MKSEKCGASPIFSMNPYGPTPPICVLRGSCGRLAGQGCSKVGGSGWGRRWLITSRTAREEKRREEKRRQEKRREEKRKEETRPRGEEKRLEERGKERKGKESKRSEEKRRDLGPPHHTTPHPTPPHPLIIIPFPIWTWALDLGGWSD